MKYPRLSAVFIAASTASLLIATTASYAQENYKGEANYKAEVPAPCPPAMTLHDGFYVGVGAGYDSYRIKDRDDLTIVDAADVTLGSTSESLNHSATGWMGGIFAGYGHYFDMFYLGAELNGNMSNADATRSMTDSNGDSAHLKIKARGSYGIGVLPGIKVNDSTLLYARLGYLRTNFKVNESSTDDAGDLDGDQNVTYSYSSSKWRNGFNYGVGLETYIAENVSVRGEYTHTSYQSKSNSVAMIDADLGTTTTITSKLKPSNNEFMLSVLYHFA
jgi:opacity protein-like surface antigen